MFFVEVNIFYFNLVSGLYFGRFMSMNRKEKFYLLFKVGEVNYIFIFGKIGYGKISFMKVFVEVLWEYYISRG